MNDKPKIFLGFVTYDRRIDQGIVSMITNLLADGRWKFGMMFNVSPFIANSRNTIVKQFLDSGEFDYLLFWDSDVIVHDVNFIEMMIETSQKLDAGIVGAMIRIKNPTTFTYSSAMKQENGEWRRFGKGEENLPIPTEPCLADVTATGLMLIKREVFYKLDDPWFRMIDMPKQKVLSEDWYFCSEAKKVGFKTAVDPRFETFHFGLAPWPHKPNG